MTPILPPRTPTWQRALRVLAAGVVGGAVATAIGLGAHHVAEDPSFRVAHVTIVGADRAPEAHLRHLADVPLDAHLATVDLDAVRRGVLRHPWVASAAVRRSFPSGVEIEVQEREPVMLLALERLWYLDAAGRPIKQVEPDDVDYPVLTGIDPALAASRPDLAAAIVQGALRAWRACDGDPVSPHQVSELHHDPRLGFEVVLTSGTRLVIGNGAPAPAFERLERMLAAGLDLDRPQRIDLDIETVAIATPLDPPATAAAPATPGS